MCDKQTRQVFAAKKLDQWKHKWDVHDLRYVNIGLALSHPHLRQVLDVVSIKPDSLTKDLKVVLIAEYCTYNLGVSVDLSPQLWPHSHRAAMGPARQRSVTQPRVHQVGGASAPVGKDQSAHSAHLTHPRQAVEYLHRNQLMHRDIKPYKIFVKDDAIKLDPSGALREWSTDGTLTPVVVTLWYRAPELLLGLKQYDFAVDLWSVGCVMAGTCTSSSRAELTRAELFMQQPLFPGNGVPDMLARIVHILGPVRPCAWPELAELSPAASTLLRAPEPPVPLTQIIPRLSRTAHDLLRGLLCYNPRARLTARQALQHEWFYEPSH